MQSIIDRGAALFQREHSDVGILDRQKLQDSLTQQVVPARDCVAREGTLAG